MSYKIKTARKTIREAFERDPAFRHAYVCRIGMWLYDEQARKGVLNFKHQEERERIAGALLDVIFEAEG